MIKEAIILAGGLGTRLRSVVAEMPKCMAPVDGTPFLSFVIHYLRQQGVTRFIFSLGYKAEMVTTYVDGVFPGIDKVYVTEPAPLGTGGAIQLACREVQEDEVLVVNGDTLFTADLEALSVLHRSSGAAVTLALKKMYRFDRYGSVAIDDKGRITAFTEKQYYAMGLINGGLYALNKVAFLEAGLPDAFSFEEDYLERYTDQYPFYAAVHKGYFVDIGLPEDYGRFCEDHNYVIAQTGVGHIDIDAFLRALRLASYNKPFAYAVDSSWTLFLDRDGVLNDEKHEDYIHTWEEFAFYEGVTSALAFFAGRFGYIVVVTNQKGVGKGLTRIEDLERIHQNMVSEVVAAGGRIDKVYYCPDLENDSPNRKPNPGMGLQAQKDLPGIDFAKAIMVGNTLSDMEFGRSLGMVTVFLATTRPEVNWNDNSIDFVYDNLPAFAAKL